MTAITEKLILEFMHAMHATGRVCVHSYLTVIIATLRLAVQIPVIYSLPNWQKEEIKRIWFEVFHNYAALILPE